MARTRKKEFDPETGAEQSVGLIRRIRRQVYRPFTLLIITTGVALTFGWPVVRKFMPNLEARREYRLTTSHIRITQPPHWVPHNLVEQVVERANLPAELPLLDEGLARDLALAFALHPWVEDVISVKKSFPAMVEVKLNYRHPVAMVQMKPGSYPVDVRGVLLPPQDFSPADARAYPQIVGVVSTPQGPAGSGWGDPIVVEAARLAAELAPYWKRLQLAAIICPRVATHDESLDAGVYMLTTSGGSEIIWGHGPDSDHPGELTISQKIERLETYTAQFGGLDQPQRRYRIDIRHWRNISRTPLSSERETGDDTR
jgi:hypothetical protein